MLLYMVIIGVLRPIVIFSPRFSKVKKWSDMALAFRVFLRYFVVLKDIELRNRKRNRKRYRKRGNSGIELEYSGMFPIRDRSKKGKFVWKKSSPPIIWSKKSLRPSYFFKKKSPPPYFFSKKKVFLPFFYPINFDPSLKKVNPDISKPNIFPEARSSKGVLAGISIIPFTVTYSDHSLLYIAA